MSIFAELSDFIGTQIAARPVEYKGKSHTFHFRELGADEAEDFFAKLDSDPKKNKRVRSKLIAMIVVDAEGQPAFTAEEAGKLPNELANTLQAIAFEVNGIGDKAKDEAKND